LTRFHNHLRSYGNDYSLFCAHAARWVTTSQGRPYVPRSIEDEAAALDTEYARVPAHPCPGRLTGATCGVSSQTGVASRPVSRVPSAVGRRFKCRGGDVR